MTKVPFFLFRQFIIQTLLEGKAVAIAVRSNDWWDFNARLVQIKSFFAHVEWIDWYNETEDSVRTINADGKKVDWYSLERYEKDVRSGKKELYMMVVNCTEEQRRQMSIEMRSQVGHDYDDAQNKGEAIAHIFSWFGNFGKAISGNLEKVNIMGDKDKFNCSESVTRGIRTPKTGDIPIFNICADFDVQAVTPEDVYKDPLIVKEFVTERG